MSEPLKIDKASDTINWQSYEMHGGDMSRVFEVKDGKIEKWEPLTDAAPPKEGEQLFVETLLGIVRMTVHLVEPNVCRLENDGHIGYASLSHEDGRWRCPGIANKRALRRISEEDPENASSEPDSTNEEE